MASSRRSCARRTSRRSPRLPLEEAWSRPSAACSARTSVHPRLPVSIDIPASSRRSATRTTTRYDVITTPTSCRGVRPRLPQENSARACARSATPRAVAIAASSASWRHGVKEGWANIPYIEPRLPGGHRRLRPAAWLRGDMGRRLRGHRLRGLHEPGGVLKYGIPDFRLPNAIIDVEIDKLRQLGIKFECNTLVGRLFTIEQMVTRWLPRRLHRHRRGYRASWHPASR